VLDGETDDGVPRVREGAEQYFKTHVEQLKMAASVCPVDAVRLEIEAG
jgi:ferredoxin